MIEEWCFACNGAGFIQVSNVNIVCPTCKGMGTLYKGRKQMSDKCNCHHWVCGCNFTIGHNSKCKAGLYPLNKGEKQMSEETTLSDTVATVTFGNEALNAVQQKIEKLKKELTDCYSRISELNNEQQTTRKKVHTFFVEQFGGTEKEVTITREEANDLLGSIYADLLNQEFEGTVTVTFSFTVHASDEDEARQIVEDAVSGLENQINAGSDDSYSQDDISVDL